MAMLLVCVVGQADSLQRFINIYKDKDGACCKVFNRDSHFNDVPANAFSPFSLMLCSGTLKVLGIEELVILQLDKCRESVRKRFVGNVCDAVPRDYSLLATNDNFHIYMSNSDDKYAYVLIVNSKLPGLTLMYVTNSFVRALVNDDGNGIDSDGLEEYLNLRAEKFGESVRDAADKIKGGLQRFQERAKEWSDDADMKGNVYF